MAFRCGAGAHYVLGSIGVSVIVAVAVPLAVLFSPLWGVFVGAVLLIGMLWYILHFLRSLHGRITETAVYVTYGVLWSREWCVPLTALRTFEVWTLPLHRLCGCRTVVLRFAGGAVWLPLIDRAMAHRLTEQLERLGEKT